jgi:hypothetical protein
MSSMLSNLSFKLKWVLSKTGTSVKVTNDLERDLVISAINASVVLKNASGSVLERMQCSFSGGTMTIVQRWLDQSETKTSDTSIQYERRVGTIWYITVLASDLLDVDNSGYGANVMPNINFYWANNHYWEEIFKDVKVQLKFRIPTFATEAARDLVYTAPVDGDKCSVGWYEQNYNWATAQWEYLWVSTPLPNASTTAAGKVKIATQTEFNDGTDEASGLYNMPTISQVKDWIDQVLIDQTGTLDDQYMLWEPVIAGQCVFVESWPTTWVATTKQNICDVTGNTRVSFPVIWTGVASDTFKVNIWKTGTGHNSDQWLYFRIEIDNAWSPSGTLIDPNAIAHILPADLTTSLVDTTMTLAWSITIPLWQKCHIVARQSDSDSYW